MSEIRRHRGSSASMSLSDAHYRNQIHEFGAFNEESCRWHIREAGMRVVPRYPFSCGIEEIYCLMLEQCGFPGLPDALSVIEDMLEQDGVADSMGDDGDIFRSWRHNWRHRNADSKDPFIPRIGSFVLPTPTPRHIRRLRAQNFIRLLENPSLMQGIRPPLAPTSGNRGIVTQSVRSSFNITDILDDDDQILPRATFAHQRYRVLFSSMGTAAAAGIIGRSQLSFAGTSDSTTGYPWPRSTDLSDSQVMSEAHTLLFHPFNGFDDGVSLTSPESTALRNETSVGCEENDLDSGAAFVDENQQDIPGVANDESKALEILPATTYEGDSVWREKRKTKVPEPLVLETFDRSESAGAPSQGNQGRPHARLRLRRESQEPTKLQRAKNREARLIDGNIILPGLCDNVSQQPLSPNEIRVRVDIAVEEEGPRMSSPGWSPSLQDQASPRYSWLDSVRTTLRPGSQGKSAKSSADADETSPHQSSKGTSKSFIWSDNGESRPSLSNGMPSPLPASLKRLSFNH
ncbi:hypothetical protein PV08_02127 [Exophiala spinifera]|uniref:Uncharacterized protein n=1 Tax=Exophiala spinifera TaxID=91928 RepID=A0A0D2A9Y1_9EURO|nr:uncharacterized protein PV08_02127 [Exophiala spinifera]KIW21547.1 hypothetical protein PV08_02127 [Exophiala spinifera]